MCELVKDVGDMLVRAEPLFQRQGRMWVYELENVSTKFHMVHIAKMLTGCHGCKLYKLLSVFWTTIYSVL